MTETQRIGRKIARDSLTGEQQAKFLWLVLQEFKVSKKHKLMVKGRKYYRCEHDILDKKRKIPNGNGGTTEVSYLTNTQLVHPTYRKMVDQKANFILGNAFKVKSDDANFSKTIDPYLDKDFMNLTRSWLINAINEGISWVRVFLDESGELKYRPVYGSRIATLWGDEQHTRLDALIYTYTIEDYEKVVETGKKTIRTFAEYYCMKEDRKGYDFFLYEEKNGKFTLLDDKHSDFKLIAGDTEEAYRFNRIPFVYLKYNQDETPLLKQVKSLIDAYDEIQSSVVDNIGDIPLAILHTRNYGGIDPDKAWQSIKNNRWINTREDGLAEFIYPKLDMTAIDSELPRLKADIYDAGNGIDLTNVSASNISSDTYKMMFSELDRDCAGVATHLASALDTLFWFMRWDMVKVNSNAQDVAFPQVEFEIEFKMNLPINRKEEVEIINLQLGNISEETRLELNPDITDTEEEKKRLLKEEAKGDAYTGAFPAPPPVPPQVGEKHEEP